MMRSLRFALLLAPALALVACGGGGGTNLVAIDQLNAEDVASATIGAANFVSEVSSLVGDLLDVIETGSSGTFPCPGGGTGSVTISDVAPVGTVSAGDSVSMTFTNCVVDLNGEAVTLDGLLEFRITSASFPGPDAHDILVQATFKKLAMGSMGTTITVNGGLSLQLETPDGIVFTSTASGSSLRASIQSGPDTSSASVSNFSYSEVFDESSGDFSFSGHGRVYESGLGGAFDSEVLVPLEGTDPEDPDTGQVESTGASGSSVLIFVLDNENIELRVDEDGDGIVDVVVPTTWTALNG